LVCIKNEELKIEQNILILKVGKKNKLNKIYNES